MASTNTTITEIARPRQREGIRPYEIDGEAVLYDLARDTVHYLNRTAWLIWNLCDGRSDGATISQAIAERFELPLNDRLTTESILGDTLSTLSSLAADGLVDLNDADACDQDIAGHD